MKAKNDFGRDLRQALADHPDYPVIVMADPDDCIVDGAWAALRCRRVEIGEFLDTPRDIPPPKDEVFYADRETLETDLEDILFDVPDEEYEAEKKKRMEEYEKFFKPCIFIWAFA